MYLNTTSLRVNFKVIFLEKNEGKHSKGIRYYYRSASGTIELGEKHDEN